MMNTSVVAAESKEHVEIITNLDGSVETYYPDGSGIVAYSDGSQEIWNADGAGFYEGADGSYYYWNADGSSGWKGSTGNEGHYNADGSGHWLNADGSAGEFFANGSYSMTHPDGATESMNVEEGNIITGAKGDGETQFSVFSSGTWNSDGLESSNIRIVNGLSNRTRGDGLFGEI